MEIKTDRLHIRDLIESDWQAMHLLRTDPVVYRYNHFGPETEADTQRWIIETRVENARSPRSSHNCAILLLTTGEIIGWIGFGVPSEGKENWGDCSFGYALRPTFWNQGYMTEALRGMLAFIFSELEAQSIFGECDVRNPASARVMENAEMRLLAEYADDEGDRSFRYFIDKQTWENL